MGVIFMEFCKCGSLKIGGNCTNKKCLKHIRKSEKITAKQISVIINLLERLEKDYNEPELKSMNTDDAQRFIEDLEDEFEEKHILKEETEEVENDYKLYELELVEELIEDTE
jgi:hypothetical protein